MDPKKRNKRIHKCTALILAFVMIFTGSVAPGIGSCFDATVYADSAWEADYLDVKDGLITKGELYDSFTSKYGSGSYKYAESKPRYGWATGGTEVKSGSADTVTLKHNQTYAVGKKGRYTWTASTDYNFTSRVYYMLTAADGDITIANGGKIYADTAAEVTVAEKAGFHGQIWFDGKLQTTIEEGMTTGTFVPGKSGEVSVVYVEASKPKHLVNLHVIGGEFGSASLDFSGEQQEGTPITLTAEPNENGYLADITLEGAAFTTLSDFDESRGKTGTFDVADSDVNLTVTFKEQTAGFGPEASFDESGNLEVYVNTDGGFDPAYIEENLYNLLAVDPAAAKPIAKDLVSIQFLSEKQGADSVWRDLDFKAPTGDWAWLHPANGYAEFPKKAGETAFVRLSWAATAQYPAGSVEQQIILADHRIPTTITGADGVVTYGATKSEVLKALQLQINGADGTSPAEPEELDLTYDGELDVDGSPHRIRVSYGGSKDYQPADAEFQLTVKKAPCNIHYESKIVTYGDDYRFALDKNPADVETINFMIGLDATGGLGSDMAVTQVAISLPESMKELGSLINVLLGEDNTVSARKLISAFTKLMKNYDDQLESMGVSTEAIETMINTLESATENMGLLDEIKITIHTEKDFEPSNVGVYLAGAVTADGNYETDFTAGYLVIVPKAAKAELEFRFQEINGIITQNLLEDGVYTLGADAYVDGMIHEEATGDISHLFLQAAGDGSLDLIYAASNDDLAARVASGELTKTGTYEQVAFTPVDNEMYYSLPIARAYTVVADGVNVQFIDHLGKAENHQTFTYDGQPKGMDVKVTMKDGTVLPKDERLTVRYIGVDAKGMTFYNDTERPVNVGLYRVIATFMDPETKLVGMATGTMTIKPGSVSLDVIDGTFEYDENYTVQVETTPAGMEKIVAIVGMSADGDIIEGEVGMINVDFPRKIDTLLKITMPFVYYKGVNLQELMDLIDRIKNVVEAVGIDAGIIDQLTGTVTGLLDELGVDMEKANITFKDTEDVKPLPIGMYTAVALSCDINHEIGVMNMGLITITEKSIEQRKIVITAEDVTKIYGEKDPEFKWNYEVTGKTENDFYPGDDFEKVVNGGISGVQMINMSGEDADVGVYENALYPQAYIHPDYQKYYAVEVKRGSLTVLPKDISQNLQIAGIFDKTYTGQEILQKDLAVKLGQTTLIAGSDYKVTYQDNVNAGQAKMTIEGIGNYTGSVDASFVIHPKRIVPEDVSQIGDQTYTGQEITPEVTVTVDGSILKEGTDYTLAFTDNKDAGQAKAVITGMGNYTTDDGIAKAVEQTFVIKEADLIAEIEKTNYVYDGMPKEPKVTVKDAVKEVDYTVVYKDNVNAGKATVIVEGKGNFKGRFEAIYSIAKAPLTIVVQPAEKTYGEPNPEFKVHYDGLQGSDEPSVITGLKLECVANGESPVGSYLIAAGGASAANYDIRYADNRLTVHAKSIADAIVTGPDKTYDGKIQKPAAKEIKVTVDGVSLKENVDFQVTGYDNNLNAGTAGIRIKGIGNYTDTARGQFQIMPAQLPDADLEYQRTTYDGKAKEPEAVINGLQEDTDFTVTYKNNIDAGTATVILTGMGNFGGTIEKTFTIDKAKDSVTLSMEGWTYGDPAKLPNGKSASGNPVTYQYLQGSKVIEGIPTDAGTYYVKATVSDSNNYVGAFVQRPFTIAKRSVSDENIFVAEIPNQQYTGQEITPEVAIYDGYRNTVLDKDDYSVTYRDNVAAGEATVIIAGRGNYKDSVTKTFSIRELGFFAALDEESFIYNGQMQKPAVHIDGYVEGTDYTVSYETDCIHAGMHKIVVTGVGKCINYEPEILYFQVTKAPAQVVVKNQSVTCGDSYTTEIEIEGLYGEDMLDGTVEFRYYKDAACTVETGMPDDAGIYYVKAFGLSSGDYDISFVPGKLVLQEAYGGTEIPEAGPGAKPETDPEADPGEKPSVRPEEKPALKPESDKQNQSENPDSGDEGDAPDTGDGNAFAAWLAVLAGALLAAGRRMKKKGRA